MSATAQKNAEAAAAAVEEDQGEVLWTNSVNFLLNPAVKSKFYQSSKFNFFRVGQFLSVP